MANRDGRKGIAASDATIDVVICDIFKPQMGIETIRRLRKSGPARR